MLKKMCFYPEIVYANAVLKHIYTVFEHAYVVLEDAYAVLKENVLLTGTCFYLGNCGFGGVSNQNILLIETC